MQRTKSDECVPAKQEQNHHNVVANRAGDVLLKNTLLKSDHFPGIGTVFEQGSTVTSAMPRQSTDSRGCVHPTYLLRDLQAARTAACCPYWRGLPTIARSVGGASTLHLVDWHGLISTLPGRCLNCRYMGWQSPQWLV